MHDGTLNLIEIDPTQHRRLNQDISAGSLARPFQMSSLQLQWLAPDR
jgi:hypothetical protein